ncbi:YihY/virulence factor BrkB family protein [Actinomyces bowdenii]|nr:YihY/virulence factor BrkB family protein [Actinomyces bowdenii]
MEHVKAWAARLMDLYQRSRLGRALARYSMARGGLMAGGIAYTGLFSVFSTLAIGVTVLMAAIGGRPALRDAVISSIDSTLPGVVDTGDGGLVTIEQLTLDSALNAGSIVAGLVLLYSAVSLMGTIRIALRAMFGMVHQTRGFVTIQAANLLCFVVVMTAVLATAVSSVATSLLAGSLNQDLDVPAALTGPGARVAGLGLSFLIDAAVLALVITVCGIRPPRRDLVQGCALGALAFGVLRQAGSSGVGSAADNPLLASFAAIIVLIVWMHLASRVLLLVAAWMANPPRPQAVDHPDEVHAHERPNYVTLSVPATLAWPRQAMTGNLDADPTEHPDYVAPVPVEEGAARAATPAPDAEPVRGAAKRGREALDGVADDR